MSVVSSMSGSRRGSECYSSGVGLKPDMNVAYESDPPQSHKALLCLRSSNALHLGMSYDEYLVHIDNGFLSVHENTGDRLNPVAGALKDRVYLRGAIVECVTDFQHNAKVHTLILSVKPIANRIKGSASLQAAHWRKINFRTSVDAKLTDASLTKEWETIIQKHILFYNQNGVILTPDPGFVFELSREEGLVDPAAIKMKTIFVNVCSHDFMPRFLKSGVIKEKRMRLICGPERILRGRTGVYNVIDVVIENEAVELSLEDVDLKAEVAWIISRELRARDRSICKVPQGSTFRFRDKTRYAGLNQDGEACGMMIDNENVRIFLLENTDLSVNAHDIPIVDRDGQGGAEFADFTAIGAENRTAAVPLYRCCVPFYIIRTSGSHIHESADAESRKVGRLNKGELVYVVGRNAVSGNNDDDMKDCWVKLLKGGWAPLFNRVGARCMHPAYDVTHTLKACEVEICSTNLVLRTDLGVWDSLFNSGKRQELGVNFTIRMMYPIQNKDGFGQSCELRVHRTLEEFLLAKEKVVELNAKAMRRASLAIADAPSNAAPDLPKCSDMTEDLLKNEDGAQLIAERVEMVESWLKHIVKVTDGVLIQFLTPTPADWRKIEASLHAEASEIII